MNTHPPTPAVRESFGQAQQQAAAMVAGPPTPWDEAVGARRRSPLWIGVATLAVVAGGVAAWLGVDRLNRPAAHPPAAMPAASERAIGPALPALPAPSATMAAAPPAAAPASLTVSREGGVIRIAASHAALADVVRALARATRTEVKGAEALAAVTSPVTLNWQGHDTPAAWEALLGRFAGTAISCAGAACELWIVSVDASRAARGVSTGVAGTTTSDSPPAAAAVTPQPQAQPQSSDENTETN